MAELLAPVNAETGEYILNVGPQHPATHGVMHLKIKIE